MLIYKICQDTLIECKFEEICIDEEQKYWIMMTPDELDKSNDIFNFSYTAIYDCMHNEDIPKLDIYENYSFGIINFINPKEDFFAVTELNIFISKSCLVLVSSTHLDLFREIENDIYNKGNLKLSIEKILYNLIDKITSKDYKILTNLELEISSVEEDLLHGKTKDYAKDIVLLKNKLLFLKKNYDPLLSIVEDLTENENKVLDNKSIAYFVILFNRIERLNKKLGELREYVTQTRESYQAQLDINLNNTMKLFTVLTAIFSPLSLIVGWYGMNYPMPEYQWKYGYLYVILLSIFVLTICLWIFKRKKLW